MSSLVKQTHALLNIAVAGLFCAFVMPAQAETPNAYAYYNGVGAAPKAFQMAALANTVDSGVFRNYFTSQGKREAIAVVQQRGPIGRVSRLIRGSGFYIGPDAILTNAHIAEGCKSVTVNDDVSFPARVLALDMQRDIALIQTSRYAKTWAALDTRPTLKEGEAVSVAGFPTEHSAFARYSHFDANITRNESANTKHGRILFSKGVLKGNSGGPVISSQDGSVVAMVTGRVRLLFASAADAVYEEAQTSGIAVSGGAIGKFLRKAPRVTGAARACSGVRGYCGAVTNPSTYTVKIACRK